MAWSLPHAMLVVLLASLRGHRIQGEATAATTTTAAAAVGVLVTEVDVVANVEHRYAITHMTTRMYNPDSEPTQVVLQMTLPKDALVSSFVMEVGGANYSGNVSDRQEESRTYDEARQQGRTAGLLELRDNDLQKLQVRASVEGLTGVTFHIAYEEVLHRLDGSYRYTVHLNPGQRVPRASVEVRVLERELITDYKILELPGQEMIMENPSTSVTGGPLSDGQLHLIYKHVDPPLGEGLGVDGAFRLSYDITNHTDGGEVQRVGSYFAHYFSPERLPKMTTHTVFLLDVSLSMYNGKLDGMKEAMKTILKDMQADDTYEILAFSSDVVSIGTFSGKVEEVKRAIRRVRRLASLGYTNMHTALLQSIKAAKIGGIDGAVKQILVFSDGNTNSGDTDPAIIRATVRRANTEHYPIFALIFSQKSKVLEEISGDSGGSWRYIHHDAATAQQILSFYSEIARPLMANVSISYPDEEADEGNIVKLGMANYYSGGEIVVAGKLRPGVSGVRPSVRATTREGPHHLPTTRLDSRNPFFSSLKDNYVARIWAYLMLQDLLARTATPQNANDTQNLRAKALEIATKFSFVSPLTSMVVVLPQDNRLTLSVPRGPQRLVGDAPSGYTALPGSRRRGRSNTRSNRPQTYVDLDPHFLVHTPGLDLPLCFNYEGRAGASVLLLHDPQSGIVINGHVASVRNRPNIKFFSQLFLRLGPVNLTVTPEKLQVDCLGDDGLPQVDTVVKSLWPIYKRNGRKYKRHTYWRRKAARKSLQHERNALHNNEVTVHKPRPRPHPKNPAANHYYSKHNTSLSAASKSSLMSPARLTDDRVNDCSVNSSWEQGVGRIYGNVMVVLSKKRSLDITIGDGLAHFTIRRSKNKRGQRFLGFYIKDQEIFSSETHGMMGQFISKRVRRMSPPGRSLAAYTHATNTNTPEKVILEVTRRGRRKKKRVTGVVSSRRSLMGRTRVRCIQVHARGSEGVLDDQVRDYLLSCLQC